MKNSLVVICPSRSDFQDLIEAGPGSGWRKWSCNGIDVFFVVGQRVFNERVVDLLDEYDEIFIAYHPESVPPAFYPKMKVRDFSRQNSDPIWQPHIKDLIGSFKRVNTDSSDEHEETKTIVKAILLLILDREGLFVRRSLQCLMGVYEEILKKAPDAIKICSLCDQQFAIPFLDYVQVPREKQSEIANWIMEIDKLSTEGLSGLSQEQRISRLQTLRDLLLGDDSQSPKGILHLLKEVTGGRVPV